MNCLVMQQTSYPRNYVPTNQQNIDNLRTLAPTNKHDSTVIINIERQLHNVSCTPVNVRFFNCACNFKDFKVKVNFLNILYNLLPPISFNT